MANDDEAQAIRRQMAAVRRDLVFAVDEVSATARQFKDWRYYVHRFPWASAAVVVAAGFLLVPKRTHIVTPTSQQLEELARRSKLVFTPGGSKQRSGDSIAGKLAGIAMMAAMRAAMAHFGQKVGGLSAKDSSKATQPAPSTSRTPK